MEKSVRAIAIVLLSAVALLLPAGTAEAQVLRGIGRGPLRPPVFPPNRMPGWDWWRTYPWSPYNYGRNPYNPIVVPYNPYYVYPYNPYVSPYPPYVPGYPPVNDDAVADGATFP